MARDMLDTTISDSRTVSDSPTQVWALWVVANAMGSAAMWALCWQVIPPGYPTGLVLAVAQSIVLSLWLRSSGPWLLGTTFGIALASAATGVVLAVYGPGLVWWRSGLPAGAEGAAITLLPALTFGLVLGVIQWMILRQVSPRAIWWVIASMLGWCASELLHPESILIHYWLDTPLLWHVITDPLSRAMTGLMLGMAYAGPTGLTLAFLLGRRER